MKRFAHFYRGVCHLQMTNTMILFLGKQLILLN